ncbi:extracellular solute-binding protein [Paenibacillus ginsengarvi]|uniref:Extracellular solute-binding protein n=1 Tax=Paenibacillus ginsengarvi TaxID=400777 RepID=A0A3B0BAW7_9BACL|nr:extracellular solute-binding protein [Paenibacillus ginsengarvi]
MIRQTNRKLFRPRLNEMVTTLRNQIVSGLLEPGQFLSSEKSLSEQYGLSLQSVRKGLDILVQEQLIVKIPKVGSQVIDPAGNGTVTIRFGYSSSIPSDIDIFALINLFQQHYPNIRVQAIPIGSRSYDQLRSYLENGMLDVMTLNFINYQRAVEIRALEDLEPLQRREELYPFLSDAFTTDGILRVQPLVFSPQVICYNRSHFKEMGLQEPNSSWTWDKLIHTAAKLEIPNERAGFRCYFSTASRASLLLAQCGGVFKRYPSGGLQLDSTPMLDAIRYGRQLYENAPSLPNSLMTWDTQKFHLFRQGKLSIMSLSYFLLNALKDSDIDYDIAPVPHFGSPLTMLIVIGLAVNKHSKNKEAVKMFVDFMTSSIAQEEIRQHTCSLPARITAAEWSGVENTAINRPSRFSLFRETIPTFRLFTDLNIKASEHQMLFDELLLYWSGFGDEQTLIERIETLSAPRPEEIVIT